MTRSVSSVTILIVKGVLSRGFKQKLAWQVQGAARILLFLRPSEESEVGEVIGRVVREKGSSGRAFSSAVRTCFGSK